MIVGKSENERPVAPGPPENRCRRRTAHPPRAGTGRSTRGSGPGCGSPGYPCPPPRSADRPRARGGGHPDGSSATARRRPGSGRSAHRASRTAPGRRLTWFVVPVRAHDADHLAAADGVDDRLRGVRGVDHQHLVVVADEPDVVLSTSQLPPSSSNVPDVTTRSTLRTPLTGPPPSAAPRRGAWSRGLLDVLELDPLGHELFERQPTLLVQVDEHREVALGQAVAVPRRLERAAAREEVDQRHLEGHVRVGTPTRTTVAGQVAGVETPASRFPGGPPRRSRRRCRSRR